MRFVKRYINEPGSVFVDRLVDPEQENNIFIALITRVEVASAFARRKKGKTLAEQDAAVALGAFAKDLDDVFITVDITPALIDSAADLATKHALRGFDAVQLASALSASDAMTANGRDVLTFVSADVGLNIAAVAEALGVENPDEYE